MEGEMENRIYCVYDSLYQDLDGNPVERTREEYPYSYDAYVTWRSGEKEEITGSIYSDRLNMWDRDKNDALKQKHFGDDGDNWSGREPKQIETFLRDWTGKQELRLIAVMEGCNFANGYPYWVFCYAA